jgi:hypothetical protein
MITLNLIPESIREENRLKHVYRLNVKLGLIIFYILIIVGVLVQVSKSIIISGFDTVKTQSDIITKNSKAYNERARDINSKISLVGQVVQGNHDWNGLILSIARLMPSGTSLYHLYLNQESKAIRIAGVAETREDLLKLKEVIDKSGYIKPVKLPMSSILEKKDISFDLESKFDYSAMGTKNN